MCKTTSDTDAQSSSTAQLPPAAWELAGVAPVALSLWLSIGGAAAPGGPVFALECVFVAGVSGGRLVACVAKKTGVPLPPLVGMLGAGILLRNVPGLRTYVGEAVDGGSSAAVRTCALALILARAGLGLDAQALKRLKWAAVRLAGVPCLVEAGTVALMASRPFVFGFPQSWAWLLGFVVAAVSPAVVVPSLLSLRDAGYGTATGIPTLVVAAAALDDVLSLAGFGICLPFAVSSAARQGVLPSTAWAAGVRAPIEIVAGLVGAGLGAIALRRFFEERTPSPLNAAAALLLVALALTFALKALGFSGGAALAALALAFLTGMLCPPFKAAGALLGQLWSSVAQPLLFALLGVSVDLAVIRGRDAGLGVALLVVSCGVRFVATTNAVRGFGLTPKERLFVGLSWLPKATVQAAVGAVALDAADSSGEKERARVVLTVAVLAIVLTAPVGAVAIAVAGPRLLTKDAVGESSHVV